jgi:hypothetical protein
LISAAFPLSIKGFGQTHACYDAIKKLPTLHWEAFYILMQPIRYPDSYWMFRLPCTSRFFPVTIVRLAPGFIVCVTFSKQLPPAIWLMTMLSPDGNTEGGITFPDQLEATFQLPFPVKVYVVASGVGV